MIILNAGQNYRVVGGSDCYLLELEGLLNKNGHEVIPFAADHEKNLSTSYSRYFPVRTNFEEPKIRDCIRYIYSISAKRAIEELLKTKHVDVAHLHIYYGQLTVSILGELKRKGIPIVQTLHEYKTVCPTYSLYLNGAICERCKGGSFYNAVLHRCNRNSIARSTLTAIESYVSKWLGAIDSIDHFIAVSDFQRQKLIELGLPSSKISTVHNFIDSDGIEPSAVLGKYFLYFGRIEKYKGIFTLLDAMHISGLSTRLLVAGTGEAMNDAVAYSEKLGLTNVDFVGFKTKQELQLLIKNCICTIIPSEWYETFGLTLLESMISGRPVIASAMGGMTEIVADGVNGLLFEAGCPDELSEKLLWMSANRSQAINMGIRGREMVMDRFSPTIHYEKMMKIYRDVLGL